MFSHGFYVLFGSLIVQFDAVAWTSFFKYHRWICICSLWIKQNLLTTRGLVICAVWSSHRSIPHLLTLLLPWRMSKVLRLWLKVLKMTKDRDISHTLWTRNSFYLFFFFTMSLQNRMVLWYTSHEVYQVTWQSATDCMALSFSVHFDRSPSLIVTLWTERMEKLQKKYLIKPFIEKSGKQWKLRHEENFIFWSYTGRSCCVWKGAKGINILERTK